MKSCNHPCLRWPPSNFALKLKSRQTCLAKLQAGIVHAFYALDFVVYIPRCSITVQIVISIACSTKPSTTMSSAQLEEGHKERETQLPAWEHENVAPVGDGKDAQPRGSTKATLRAKLDSIMPPHRRYLGMSRKIFLWVLLAAAIALFVLIIGLAAGLSSKSG